MGVSVRRTCGHPIECPTVPWDTVPWDTVPWDHGMGRTVGHTCICRGTGGHPVECPIVPWDCGMGWTIYGVSGSTDALSFLYVISQVSLPATVAMVDHLTFVCLCV